MVLDGLISLGNPLTYNLGFKCRVRPTDMVSEPTLYFDVWIHLWNHVSTCVS